MTLRELDLSPGLPPPQGLPTWLPEETLFSLCSRYHVLSGAFYARTTCQTLFGHSQRGSQHDLPSRIDHLAEATRGALGPAADIILGHTLLPYYLPFKSNAVAADAVAAMRGDGIGSLKYRLGLLTSGWGAHHPLRACPACMAADVRAFGIAYWHLTHQLPGVLVCLRHGGPLLESDLKANGVGRFLWLLPGGSTWHQGPADTSNPGLLQKLAEACTAIAQLPRGFFFDGSQLAATYEAQLMKRFEGKQRGLSQKSASDFVAFCQPLQQIPELRALPESETSATSQITRLLDPARCLSHPLRHAIYILYLFGSWPAFMRAYEKPTKPNEPEESRPKVTTGTPPKLRARVIASLKEGGRSPTAIAEEFGLDVLTVMTWAAAAGLEVHRRPKILKGEVMDKVSALLLAGDDKADIAISAGISESSVTRVLRLSPELSTQWHSVRNQRLKESARHRWLTVIHDNPLLGAKAVRMLEPAAYAWLYRNDRAWLEEALQSLPKAARAHTPRVKWDVRDQELSAQVRQAALALASTDLSGRKITLRRLFQYVPDLRVKAAHLDRLPLTLLAIKAVVNQPLSSSLDLTE